MDVCIEGSVDLNSLSWALGGKPTFDSQDEGQSCDGFDVEGKGVQVPTSRPQRGQVQGPIHWVGASPAFYGQQLLHALCSWVGEGV